MDGDFSVFLDACLEADLCHIFLLHVFDMFMGYYFHIINIAVGMSSVRTWGL